MSDLRQAAQQALEALEYYQHRRLEWDYSDEVAITALKAALAGPPVDDPHRGRWVAIAEAAQKIAASKECGLMEAKALCAALDRLTDATLAEPVQPVEINRDTVIRLAREADLWMTSDERIAAVERFAALVAAAERETCAKVVWSTPSPADEYVSLRDAIAAAIRRRT